MKDRVWLGVVALPLALVAVAARAAPVLTGDGGVSAFYAWTQPLPKTPGVLLRQEPLPPELSIDNAGSAVRFLYSSTNGLDGRTRMAESAALFLPRGQPPAGGWPLIAWAHGTVGVADVCAPSWNARSARDKAYLGYWLSQGYAIVAADYQGLGTPGVHPWLAARPEAYSILDSVRAVRGGKFNLSQQLVLVGQSQGGAGVVASAGYASAYAPELKILGVVATGTPYFSAKGQRELDAARPKDAVSPFLGFNLFGLAVLEETDPDFRVDDYVTEAAGPALHAVATGCYNDIGQAITQTKLTYNRTFKRDPADRMAKVFALTAYPTLKLTQPLFMGTGGADLTSPVPMQLLLGQEACDAGTRVEAHLYPGMGHGETVDAAKADAGAFVRKLLAGEPIAGNCQDRPRPPAANGP